MPFLIFLNIFSGRATLGKRTCLALRVAQAQMSSASSVPAELNLNAYPVSYHIVQFFYKD